MQLDLHCSRFDWAGGPAGIGPGVADLAQRAEAIGVRTLSFMDHFFQMDWMAPAERPDARGLHRARLRRRAHPPLRLRLLVTGVTYRHPGLLAKTVTTLDVVSGGRAELGIGAAWYEREHRGLGVPFPPTAERFERLEETIQICLQMWSDDNGALRGRHYQLDGDAVQPGAGEHAAAADHDRRQRRTEDAPARRPVRRRVQHHRRRPTRSRTSSTCSRRHCDTLGRDPNEIEVTAMYREIPARRDHRRRRSRRRSVRRDRCVDARDRRDGRRPRRLARVDVPARDGAHPRHRTARL